MKYKKSMIILITTIFLFSIASVCASDTNTTAMAVVDEQITEEINEIEADNPASDDSKILGSSAGNEILKSGSIIPSISNRAHTQETARLILRIMQIVSPSLGIPQYWMDRD